MIKLKWISCEDKVPLKDGKYLAVMGLMISEKMEITYITEMEYVADMEGGWNCGRSSDGTIRNEYRINSVIAWSDCLDEIKQDAEKEIKKWYS